MRFQGRGEVGFAACAEGSHALDPLRCRSAHDTVPKRQQPRPLHDRPEAVAFEIDAPVLGLDPAEKADRGFVAASRLCELAKEGRRVAGRTPRLPPERGCEPGIAPDGAEIVEDVDVQHARASRWAVFSLPGGPGTGRSASPSGPYALNLSTQSRIVCKPTPPTQAAFVREPPS